MRAQNSKKKNNFNQKKIDRHIKYIDEKLKDYGEALSEADGDSAKQIEDKISKHKEQKKKYQSIEKQLEESGEKQISTSDPDSRQLIIRGAITEVAYNVPNKNYNVSEFEYNNKNDTYTCPEGEILTTNSN